MSADSVNETTLQLTEQFITVDENAKLFKVKIGDYVVENGGHMFIENKADETARVTLGFLASNP